VNITEGYFLAITGKQLKKLRTEVRLTQKKLGKLAGVSQAHIAKIETGKVDPRLSTINRILKVLSERREKSCKDVMTIGVIFTRPEDSILEISELMIRHAISQMPVKKGKKIVGTVTEENIVRNLRASLGKESAENIMDPPLPIVEENLNIEVVRPLLEEYPGILVTRSQEIVGIITRSDLLEIIGQNYGP
jgi:predicted transcriptional regulator